MHVFRLTQTPRRSSDVLVLSKTDATVTLLQGWLALARTIPHDIQSDLERAERIIDSLLSLVTKQKHLPCWRNPVSSWHEEKTPGDIWELSRPGDYGALFEYSQWR